MIRLSDVDRGRTMTKGKPRRDGGPEVDERQLDEYWFDDLFQAVETGEDFAVFALAL